MESLQKIKTISKMFDINKMKIKLFEYDTAMENTKGMVKEFLSKEKNYNLDIINFKENDIVIDIGANIGLVSIYLAKKYPFVTIYSYEPIPDSYKHLLMSIKANKVYNIKPFNKSITGDGRNVTMVVNLNDTGGGSFNAPEAGKIKCGHTFYPKIKSIFLDKVFIENKIKKCKFLKIDCEGAEYEILLNSKMLNRIEYFSGEFHYNKYLTGQGNSSEKLYNHLIKYIKRDNIKYHICKMAE